MMKILLAFIVFLISSMSLYASKIPHNINWNTYMENHKEFLYRSAYMVQIFPENKLNNPKLAVTDIIWEQLSDTILIKRLKLQPYHEIFNSVNLFSASGKQIIEVSIDPIKKEGDSLYRIVSFCVEIEKNESSFLKSEKIIKNQSILATGFWIRLATISSGVQKISYSRLTELGIKNPANLAMYSNGGFMLPKMNNTDYPDDLTQIPVLHSKDKSGQECVYFHATGTAEWKYDSSRGLFLMNNNLYSDSTYFYVSSDVPKSPEPLLNKPISLIPDTFLNSYTACSFYEKENINLIQSGRRWFSDIISNLSSRSYSFSFPDVLTGSTATVTIASAARCFKPSLGIVRTNNSYSDTIRFNPVADYEYTDFVDLNETDFKVTPKENMNIELNFNTFGESGTAWLDYISLNVKSQLIFRGTQILIKSPEQLNHNSVQYNISSTFNNGVLWKITNPLHPEKIQTLGETNGLSFKDSGGSINEYVLFDPVDGVFPEQPKFSGKIKNQNIHGLPSFEMIIVTHPDFLKQSEILAEFHRQNDNMSVLVLTTSEIYNEFSSGLPDVSAIRNMLRFFYSRDINTLNPLRYVLLMGDGSYDNRKFDRSKNNYIPTYQSENSINKGNSYVMDDFFGLLDENEGESKGLLDIGVGRIPCKTPSEAQDVINKIITYSSSQTFGEWRNVVCFIADDEDNNYFMDDSEGLINLINKNYSGFDTKKIYFDSYQQISTSGGQRYPDVTTAINNIVNDGALIINYVGHANPTSLAHENVLVINDIKSWNNSKSLPLFLTATCEFGRFDDDKVSAGEEILLNPVGGGVGLFTTTRVVYNSNNYVLSTQFYSNIFKLDDHGEKLRLGDVMKNAKNSTNDTNKYNFSLLADPALRLAFPRYKVITTSINNVDINKEESTIGALDKVTIKGEVVDASGSLLTNYKGEITTVVYDKVIEVETLNNDGVGAFTYPVQNNVIYKGLSLVEGGKFELSFIVPKDIFYNIDKGRIIYYTSNGEEDGNGSTTQFNIGGSSINPVIDNNAPEMNIYINNESFKSYDMVSSSALLLVNLFDESGINTVGTGLGHDLVAILDDDYSNQMVLNDFYSSEPNSYQRGKIIYPLTNLEPGEHKIWVKVWDVQNNSTEKEIYFMVGDGFKVTNVQNTPNPVSSFTDFEISHNLPGQLFDVTIDIYNLNGQRINQIKETVSSKATTKIKVRWSIFQSDYPVFNNQWLVYRVTMSNQEGLNAQGAGKILINMKN